MSRCLAFIRRNKPIIDLMTLVALVATAVFVIMYWAETQAMKEEMITQNKINSQSLKSSLLPLVDVQFEAVKPMPEMSQFKTEFAYDIFLQNKGNGPAFNVLFQRLVMPDKNKQKRALRPTTKGKLKPFSKRVHMIGLGEKIKIYREHSDSYEYMKITVTYKDHFKEIHKCVFEGDRDGLKLIDYPILKEYLKVNQKTSENS